MQCRQHQFSSWSSRGRSLSSKQNLWKGSQHTWQYTNCIGGGERKTSQRVSCTSHNHLREVKDPSSLHGEQQPYTLTGRPHCQTGCTPAELLRGSDAPHPRGMKSNMKPGKNYQMQPMPQAFCSPAHPKGQPILARLVKGQLEHLPGDRSPPPLASRDGPGGISNRSRFCTTGQRCFSPA